MALIHIIRDVPEYKGGSCEMDIQEQDLPKLQYRGWRVADKKSEAPKVAVKEEVKESVSETKVVEEKPETTRVFKKGDK